MITIKDFIAKTTMSSPMFSVHKYYNGNLEFGAPTPFIQYSGEWKTFEERLWMASVYCYYDAEKRINVIDETRSYNLGLEVLARFLDEHLRHTEKRWPNLRFWFMNHVNSYSFRNHPDWLESIAAIYTHCIGPIDPALPPRNGNFFQVHFRADRLDLFYLMLGAFKTKQMKLGFLDETDHTLKSRGYGRRRRRR